MDFPAIPDDHDLAGADWPATQVGWGALDNGTLAAFREILTSDTLIDVEDSFLAAAVQGLPFTVVGDRRCLALHVVEFWYARVCTLSDDVVALDPPIDLCYGVAPSGLARADALARKPSGQQWQTPCRCTEAGYSSPSRCAPTTRTFRPCRHAAAG